MSNKTKPVASSARTQSICWCWRLRC